MLLEKTFSPFVGGAFLLIIVTACSIGPSYVSTSSETGSRVTEVAPPSTDVTPIPTDTQTPTPTKDPNAISAEELMKDKLNPFIIETSLVGTVSLAGENVELNYPNLEGKITFAFDKSIIDRSLEETGFPPYSQASINPDYLTSMNTDEEGAKREIITHILFFNYMGWQRDEDGKYFNERKNVSFTDYLDKLSKGEDVGYHLWVVTENGKGYPNERIYIDPHLFLNLDVYFTVNGNNPGEILGSPNFPEDNYLRRYKDGYRFFYDKTLDKIVLAVNITPLDKAQLNNPNYGYYDFLHSLATLPAIEVAQRRGWQFTGADNNDNLPEIIKEFIRVILLPLKGNLPLIVK